MSSRCNDCVDVGLSFAQGCLSSCCIISIPLRDLSGMTMRVNLRLVKKGTQFERTSRAKFMSASSGGHTTPFSELLLSIHPPHLTEL